MKLCMSSDLDFEAQLRQALWNGIQNFLSIRDKVLQLAHKVAMLPALQWRNPQ